MSFVIRSANGERSLSKITNKEQNRAVVRDELIEALKGLTIKFEIKVVDIVQSNETQEPDQPAAKEAQVTFASRAGDILSELKTKLANEQQQINQFLTEQTRDPARPQLPKTVATVSTIRPAIGITKPTSVTDTNISQPKKDERQEEVIEKNIPKIEVTEPKINKLLEVPSKSSKVAQNSGNLVKGNLQIGTTTKTCCIWIDESKQPPVPYISYSSDRLTQITSMITNMALSIEAQPTVSSIDVGDIVFAKSKDDNAWYRSMVERVGAEDLDVYLFDWGLTETLDLSRIRRLSVLELGLSSNPATALKIRITNPPGPLVDKFLECDSIFDIRVDSYDEFDDTYSVTILAVSSDSS